MATVKLCDRCNNKIEKRRGVINFKPIFINAVLNMQLFDKGYLSDYKYQDRDFDLCENCSNEFAAFMNGAELVTEEGNENGDDRVE